MNEAQYQEHHVDFDAEYRKLTEQLRSLPGYSEEDRERTAKELSLLHFSFEMGRSDIDLVRISKEDLLAYFREIASWNFEDALQKRNLEPEYTGGDRQAYTDMVRLERMRFLLRKFVFITRLRADEPEAWDTVNELFFDD